MTRSTILIVDDAPDNIMLLVALLKEKYGTKVATNGATALQILRSGGVDLVLLDVMMPGLDGHEVCRRIRQDPATAGLPVIFLTAKNQPEDEEKCRAAGGAAYIAKPVDPRILFDLVARHLAPRHGG